MNHNEDRKEDQPLYSRLFVVCGKQTKEHDLRTLFEEYGTVEDVFIPRNRSSGESKGFAYVKYTKTSCAAMAIKALNLTHFDGKPLKVMVAANRNEPQTSDEYGDKYTRLFIKIPKDCSESEIKEHFRKFGKVLSVFIVKDRVSGLNKGFAYVRFGEFYDAAKAFEECDKVYKPIFATPKDLKRDRSVSEDDIYSPNKRARNYSQTSTCDSSLSNQDYTSICVKCRPIIPEKCIYQLCNIIPGMKNCQYSVDSFNGICRAIVTFDNGKYAKYATEKLDGFEFPAGEILSVNPEYNPLVQVATDLSNIVDTFKKSVDSGTDLRTLADAIEKATSLIKAAAKGHADSTDTPNYCNVPLPSLKPLSNDAKVAQRLFIICKPQPPPLPVLQDAFCRFGDFISVSTIPNKTFGFVKYASVASAQEAMKVLNGTLICGMRLKVVEADEKPLTSNEKMNNFD